MKNKISNPVHDYHFSDVIITTKDGIQFHVFSGTLTNAVITNITTEDVLIKIAPEINRTGAR